MRLLEIYAGEHGETHFRSAEFEFEGRDLVPPLPPMVSKKIRMTTGMFFVAPPGWGDAYQATPRKQFAVTLSGTAKVTTTDGETIVSQRGDCLLLNDEGSKGHLTQVQGGENFCAMLIGLAAEGA